MSDYEAIRLGGYEGDFRCPNCDYPIDISQGNNEGEGATFTCPEYPKGYSGCGKEWQVFAKEN